MEKINLSQRQKKILEIVKEFGPISGEEIASRLNVSRSALRPCLTVLTMSGLLEARPRVGYTYAGKNAQSLFADYLRRFTVGEVKAVPAVVREETSVYDAIVALFVEDVGTLFVVDEEGFLQGVLSRKDLLKAAIGGSDLLRIPVAVIMTRMPHLVTVEPDLDVVSAAKKIVDYQIDALPVVRETEEGKLKVIGKITKTTLARLLAEVSG
ncbi:MAG: helix-turn-helix transcriptional regulator [Firmicutes bacterium]|nr:helix-turn-helix transcriptional regulator [Bacillota bacterium]